MTYTCGNCNTSFEHALGVDTCPVCHTVGRILPRIVSETKLLVTRTCADCGQAFRAYEDSPEPHYCTLCLIHWVDRKVMVLCLDNGKHVIQLRRVKRLQFWLLFAVAALGGLVVGCVVEWWIYG